MGIQKDSGELLLFIYEKKTKGEEIPSRRQIENKTGWNKDRVLNALQYLHGKNLIDGRQVKTLGTTKIKEFSINDITPNGIDVIENEKEFAKTFNFKINLGVFSYSWGVTEK